MTANYHSMIGEPIFEHKEQFADCLEQLQQTAITVKNTCAEQAIRYLLLPPAHGLPHLHMAAHRCRIQRVTPNPPGAYIAPKKTGVPPQ